MSSTGMNGCHNRKPLRKTALVQFGWVNNLASRLPIMIYLPDPMTKTCQYQLLKKDDPKCAGCRELVPA